MDIRSENVVPGVTCRLLPECPLGVDFSSQTEFIPGKNCKIVKPEELPFCPDESKPKTFGIRSDEVFIPGVTCRSLPDCPLGIDFSSQTEFIPGKNCKLVKPEQLPFCQDESKSNKGNIRSEELPGITCRPLPNCPLRIDFRSDTEFIPGKNCKIVKLEELPFCLDESKSNKGNIRSDEVPGITCKPLPNCPLGIDFRSETEFTPGKNCKLVKPEELPFCSDESKSNKGNIRSDEVPGITCRPLPKCPIGIDFTSIDLASTLEPVLKLEAVASVTDFTSQTEFIPGKNCRLVKPEELPFCKDESEDDDQKLNIRSNKVLIPGVTCRLLPECPKGIDFSSQSEFIPGKNCEYVEPEELIDCPEGVDFTSQSEWLPGINCKLVTSTVVGMISLIYISCNEIHLIRFHNYSSKNHPKSYNI